MSEQAANVTLPAELTPAACERNPSAGAHSAAADGCVSPPAQGMPAVNPSDVGCSEQTIEPSSQLIVAKGPAAQGQPPLESRVLGTVRADGRGGMGSKPSAEAAAAARAELVRRWPETMKALEPCSEARAAAAARVADLDAAAERRADAARMQACQLPRRVTDKYLWNTWAACSRSLKAKLTADERVLDSLNSLLKELRALEDSCQSLVDAAHSAGLAWLQHGVGLSVGDGPDVAAARAWCADFVAVSAGVHEAQLQAQTMGVPTFAAVDRFTASFRGEARASLSL